MRESEYADMVSEKFLRKVSASQMSLEVLIGKLSFAALGDSRQPATPPPGPAKPPPGFGIQQGPKPNDPSKPTRKS